MSDLTEQDIEEAKARANGTLYEHGGAPAKHPCGTCPYRKDVPSGVWAAEEYDKLPPFDGDTFEQPTAVFFCHQQDGRLCAGWVGCHDMSQSLGLRLAVPFGSITMDGLEAALDYVSPVPLWESGAAAAEHGKADIDAPDERADKAIEKVKKRHSRMRGQRPLGAYIDEAASFPDVMREDWST